ncbi:MAG: FlgD immunoglobulin-like domain containing protein [Candidatus Krumholzibacteria bacterium]
MAAPVRAPAQVPQFILEWGSFGTADGQFKVARRLAVGPDGSVFVADRNNARIQKFTGGGVFITKWGSAGSGDGQFDFPFGVAVDDSGHVYVGERNNNRIQKFTSEGVFLLKWGTPGNGDGEFNFPVGVAVGPSGNVYVADSFNNRIQKFTGGGTFITKWGSFGSGNGQFDSPVTLAVDGQENVYVGDAFNFRIQKFAGDGTFITKWGSEGDGDGQFGAPRGIGVDRDDNIYVVDQIVSRVQKFTSDGDFLLEWGMPGSGDGQFGRPEDCDVDDTGNIFVTDPSNDRIQKFGVEIVPVTLVFFSVQRSAEGAVVKWRVHDFAAEYVEFHVYRNAPGQARTPITTTPLAGQETYRHVDPAPPRGGADYWLQEIGSLGTEYWHGPVPLAPALESGLILAPNYPNPFNPVTMIRYTLPADARVTLTIHDAVGRRIRMLVDGDQAADTYEVEWNGRDDRGAVVPSGVYFSRLRTGSNRQTRKMVLLK